MNALTWAALSIVATCFADRADNGFGRFAFTTLAGLLFTAGLLAAPWNEVIA